MRSLPLLLLLACVDPDSEDTAPPPTPDDPHVATWTPEFAPFDSVDRVIFFGDSLTRGFGLRNQNNAYMNLLVENNDDAWPEFAGNDLTTRYGELEVDNFGVSGAETWGVRNQQIPAMESALGTSIEGRTLIFITIGGNDLFGAMTSGGLPTIADEVEDNLRAIAEDLTDPDRFPDGSLLLITNVYEPTDGEGQADQCFLGLSVEAAEPVLDDINARSLALAQDLGFAWVDLRAHFTGHGWNHDNASIAAYDEDDPTLWFQEDCIHANKRGHHELRRLFMAAVDGEPLSLWTP